MATPERFAADFLTAAETGWKDVHSPEYDADPRAAKIAQALRAAGVTQAHVLGSGSFGLAAAMQDGRVVKLTTDESEVAAGHVLLGRQLRHVAHVYGAWFVRGVHVDRWDVEAAAGAKGRVGLLITERVAPLDYKVDAKGEIVGQGAEVSRVWKDIRRRFGASPESLALMTHAESRKILRLASKQLESELRYIADTQQDPIAHQVADALRELRGSRVYSIDVHAGNIGYSHQDGVFKVFDIGSSSSPAGEKPPELPHVSRMTRGGMVEEGVEVGEIGEDVDVTARAVERVQAQPTVQAFFPDGVVVQMPLDPTARPRAQWATRHEYPVQRVRVADLVARQQVVGRKKVVEYLTNGWNEPIMVEMRGDGTALIVDGHHRAYAAYLRGDEYIDAYVVPMGQEVADEEAVRVRRRMRRPTWNRGGDAVDMPLADIVPSSKPDYDNAWSELHLDPFGTDPNAEIDWTKVRRYVRISKKEPATVVMRDGTAHLLDGYHRFVANKLAGEKTMRVEVVPDGEANGAAEDVIKLDRDAVYKGAERVVQAYARTLKRVPFDKGAEAVRTWFQIEASMVEGEPTVEGASMTPFYDYPGDLKDVRGNEIEVRVMRLLVLREQNYGLIVDAFTQAVKRGRAANIWIRINLGSPEIEKLRDQPELFVPRFASIFLHELTHVRDVIKMGHVVAPEDNREAYYNSDHEVRAYGRQIVEDVIIQARFNRDVRLAPTNEQLVERALANSQHWLQVEPWLTDENKEKIYRFVYRGLEREGLFKRSGSMRLPRTQRSRAAEDDGKSEILLTDAQIEVARDNKLVGFIRMEAIDFLRLTIDARDDDSAEGFVHALGEYQKLAKPLAQYNEWTREGKIRIAPGLGVTPNGHVVSHEGRHRAAALVTAAGEDAVMLVGIELKNDDGYNWSPRAMRNPARLHNVPPVFYGQWLHNRDIAVPVTLDGAMDLYEGDSARESPRDVIDAAPLPFALVRVGDDVLPVLLGDGSPDPELLSGVDFRGELRAFGASDIVGLVNAEPAAVYYGVRAEVHEGAMRMAAESPRGDDVARIEMTCIELPGSPTDEEQQRTDDTYAQRARARSVVAKLGVQMRDEEHDDRGTMYGDAYAYPSIDLLEQTLDAFDEAGVEYDNVDLPPGAPRALVTRLRRRYKSSVPRVHVNVSSGSVAEEAGQPGVKKGDTILQFPGIKARKGMSFRAKPRGERFRWTPERPRGLTAFPEIKKVLLRQREAVPSLESIRMAAIFAGLTVHAGTSEAEDTFGRVVAKYKAMHGAMPPVEEIQQIIGTHLPAARLRMYETVLPWAVIVQDAMKRGLRDRELRRHIWVDIADEDQVENIGLAKMSFAFMLMGQNVCCLDSHILGGMAATKPWDPNDPQGAAIRRRDAGDRISGLWKWSPAKKGRELGLRRYEQLEDALIKGNPWHESGPLDRAQTQWQSWEFAIGIPAAHRVWLEVTKELQAKQSDWDLQQVAVPF